MVYFQHHLFLPTIFQKIALSCHLLKLRPKSVYCFHIIIENFSRVCHKFRPVIDTALTASFFPHRPL